MYVYMYIYIYIYIQYSMYIPINIPLSPHLLVYSRLISHQIREISLVKTHVWHKKWGCDQYFDEYKPGMGL